MGFGKSEMEPDPATPRQQLQVSLRCQQRTLVACISTDRHAQLGSSGTVGNASSIPRDFGTGKMMIYDHTFDQEMADDCPIASSLYPEHLPSASLPES